MRSVSKSFRWQKEWTDPTYSALGKVSSHSCTSPYWENIDHLWRPPGKCKRNPTGGLTACALFCNQTTHCVANTDWHMAAGILHGRDHWSKWVKHIEIQHPVLQAEAKMNLIIFEKTIMPQEHKHWLLQPDSKNISKSHQLPIWQRDFPSQPTPPATSPPPNGPSPPYPPHEPQSVLTSRATSNPTHSLHNGIGTECTSFNPMW